MIMNEIRVGKIMTMTSEKSTAMAKFTHTNKKRNIVFLPHFVAK